MRKEGSCARDGRHTAPWLLARQDPSPVGFWNLCALSPCARQGHLVTITSPAEQLYVEQLVSTSEYMGKLWIGMASQTSAAPFEWVTGEQVSFTNWDSSHASESAGDTCVVMDPLSGGKWRDYWCKAPAGSQPASYSLPFVVEYDCATTDCGTVPDSGAAQFATDGPPCKGEDERCWAGPDCCEGFACRGDALMYCRK
jgi:Lectin C-type domain